MTQTVPLNKLDVSPRNVRKTDADEDIAGLAESIRSKGLLQNLVVSEAAKGRYEVDAGGRRLRALQLLAEQKHLPKNWPVPVHVIAVDAATEASLAENLQKIAMNPADEVEAFATIVAGYEANGMASRAERIANCARRFGVTERHVAQRLALADLAPEILDAMRAGTIGIAAARAYAGHPDQAEQLKIFRKEEKQAYRPHDVQRIRDAIAGRAYPADHPLARYVGLIAYRAAGGRIEADLFFEEGERELWIDRALVEKLAQEKAEGEAQALAQGQGWLDAAVVKVWLPSWQQPTAPKGFAWKWQQHDRVPADQRATAIACYALQGDTVQPVTGVLYPVPDAADAAASVDRTREYQANWEERERRREIRLRAFRLAFPSVAGTVMEGRAFWPKDDSGLDDLEDLEDGNVTAVMLVQLPREAIEARLADAEREYEEARAAQEEPASSSAAVGDENASTADEPETESPAPGQPDPNVNDMAEAKAA